MTGDVKVALKMDGLPQVPYTTLGIHRAHSTSTLTVIQDFDKLLSSTSLTSCIFEYTQFIMTIKRAYLVTLTTGHQGRATAEYLLKQGNDVHAFVRHTNSPKAKELEKLGCKIFKGSASQPETIAPAIANCDGIFLSFCPGHENPEANIVKARTYLEAATVAQVSTVVVSTTIHTERNAERSSLYNTRFAIEEVIRNSSIRNKVFLRPAWLMQNYFEPLCDMFFPRFKSDHILDTCFEKGSKISHFDVHDIGKLAAEALVEPDRWNGRSLDLGHEQLDMEVVASTISRATGIKIEVNYLDSSGVLGIDKLAGKTGIYNCQPFNEEKYGLTVTKFEDWVEREKEALQKILAQGQRSKG